MKTIRSFIAWLLRSCFGLHFLDTSDHPAPTIYFANHSSHLDFLLIWASLPNTHRETTRPVAALDYWGATPFRKWIACHLFRAVLLDRRTLMRRSHPLAPLMEVLEKGESLIIFPEGTRHLENHGLGKFKAGLYLLHQQFPKTNVTPVWLHNAGRAYPKGALLPIPLRITVNIGCPLSIKPQTVDRMVYLDLAKRSLSSLQQAA